MKRYLVALIVLTLLMAGSTVYGQNNAMSAAELAAAMETALNMLLEKSEVEVDETVVGDSLAILDSDNNIDSAIIPGDKFSYRMQVGDTVSEYSELGSNRDYDIFVFKLKGEGIWSVEVLDCCLQGDTMKAIGFINGRFLHGKATSDAVMLGPVTVKRSAMGFVIVTYAKPNTGVWPAGYDISASFLP